MDHKKALFELLANIKDVQEMENLFADLCTKKEMENMAERLYAAKLLLEKIGAQTPILSTEEFDRYTGPFFLFYALIR